MENYTMIISYETLCATLSIAETFTDSDTLLLDYSAETTLKL